ncbi:MAG: DUF2085 domain-containing protein [Deltaproteobacteria bacterium]|nr:DUF2085 domain-containing protein [Deltaproteobacteria bacterium]
MGVVDFLLAHHRPDEYDRCYSLGGVHLCARCAGLYPALALLLALQLQGVVGAIRAEWAVLYLLPMPAIFSWARRRLTGAAGSNPVSTVTGALLGVALGRGIFLYLRDHGSVAFWVQAVALVVVVLTVEILARLKNR